MTIPDREQQRREYVWKKAGVAGEIMVSGILSLMFAASFLIFFIVTLVLLVFSIGNRTWDGLFLLGIPAILSIGSGVGFLRTSQFFVERKIDIPYVPPVTPNTLPSEEILVRASLESVQEQSTVLLRASENMDVPAEELLRASTDSCQEELLNRQKV